MAGEFGNVGERLVYHDRIKNIQNAVATFKDYDLYTALETLLIGFGENNRKLIFGNRSRVPKGAFDYSNAYAFGGR